MIEKHGNLFDTEAHHIGHGVNTYGMMGAGIAKQFKDRYPEMFDAYHKQCSYRTIAVGDDFRYDYFNVTIHNIASQDRPGPHANYAWLARGLSRAMVCVDQANDSRIAIPEIGCGIGGLEWPVVKNIIIGLERMHNNVEVEVWHYTA